MSVRLPLTVLVLLALSAGAQAQLVINEVLAVNRLTNVDEDGDNSDWVELYNPTTSAIDLKDFSISDDVANPQQWLFPAETIGPKSYLLVWCSGKDRIQPEEDALDDVPFLAGLVNARDEWRYLAAPPETEGPPANWFAPDFDDAGLGERSRRIRIRRRR